MTIKQTFESLKIKNESALIVYLTAGFPGMDQFTKDLRTVDRSGADIIEIGIPFSDPIADGPSIQASSQIGLQNNASISKIIDLLKEIKINKPLVFMSYLNPLMAYGQEKLLNDMIQAGVTGLIIPDLPVEESESWQNACQNTGIDLIFLLTPVSPSSRKQMITNATQGFVYCVSLTGTTGARKDLPEEIFSFLDEIRQMTDKPLAVGFGISQPEHIHKLKEKADGMIVGSRIINAIRDKEDLATVVRELKAATVRTGE